MKLEPGSVAWCKAEVPSAHQRVHNYIKELRVLYPLAMANARTESFGGEIDKLVKAFLKIASGLEKIIKKEPYEEKAVHYQLREKIFFVLHI